MMQTVLHSTPRSRGILLEQVRAAGFALRRPAVAVSALAALATLLIGAEFLDSHEAIRFHPEHQMLPGMVGLLLPVGGGGRTASGPASSGRSPWIAVRTRSPKFSPGGCG